ncbi:MAG TPA: hypothetical protein VKA60_10805 [Blastocatellia bacterium]|nr:hypothetical protein [Blastocatellia bacterium]
MPGLELQVDAPAAGFALVVLEFDLAVNAPIRVRCRAENLSGLAGNGERMADIISTSVRDSTKPCSTFKPIMSPGLISHSSNQTRRPSARNRSAKSRAAGLSLALWLMNTS